MCVCVCVFACVCVCMCLCVCSMYSVFIERNLECQGSEEHLFSCASTSNETCDTQVHNSSADFVMLFCTNVSESYDYLISVKCTICY